MICPFWCGVSGPCNRIATVNNWSVRNVIFPFISKFGCGNVVRSIFTLFRDSVVKVDVWVRVRSVLNSFKWRNFMEPFDITCLNLLRSNLPFENVSNEMLGSRESANNILMADGDKNRRTNGCRCRLDWFLYRWSCSFLRILVDVLSPIEERFDLNEKLLSI